MDDQPNWERAVLEKTALAAVTEQRRARRWRIFFRFAWLAVIGAMIWSVNHVRNDDSQSEEGAHTAVIDLNGEISSENDTATRMAKSLGNAFKNSGTRAVVIRANSPGGSPVLSGMVSDEITRQRKLHPTIPIYMAVEDVCASGCYYIASAANKIFVNKASIIGSIGVRTGGFGFTDAMKKIGVERRLLTAGKNKDIGDPFSPVTPEQQAFQQVMLDNIHQQFITAVKAGRGARLKDDPMLFSGLYWVGDQGVQLGLADGYGSVASIARDVVKAPKLVDYTSSDGITDRLGKRLGMSLALSLSHLFGIELDQRTPRLY